MGTKNIAIVTHSNGGLYDFSGTGAEQFDYGTHSEGTVITYEFRSPHWAVNRQEIYEEEFFGELTSEYSIEFRDFRGEIACYKKDFAPDVLSMIDANPTVAFTIGTTAAKHEPHAQNIRLVN